MFARWESHWHRSPLFCIDLLKRLTACTKLNVARLLLVVAMEAAAAAMRRMIAGARPSNAAPSATPAASRTRPGASARTTSVARTSRAPGGRTMPRASAKRIDSLRLLKNSRIGLELYKDTEKDDWINESGRLNALIGTD